MVTQQKTEGTSRELQVTKPNLGGTLALYYPALDASFGTNIEMLPQWSGLGDTNESRRNIQQEFKRVKEQWISETRHESITTRMMMHPCFGRIAAMGYSIVPSVFEELAERPSVRWFPILHAITGISPMVPEQARGDVQQMANAWLEWRDIFSYQQMANAWLDWRDESS
ncbi:MAG: hypothetical protein IH860_00100 [Chloroflexi bacterium]|nr:hypothetical protein [Chloroflexota bacterium]